MRDHHDTEWELHYLKKDMARIKARIEVVQQEHNEAMAEMYGLTVEEYESNCARIKTFNVGDFIKGRVK